MHSYANWLGVALFFGTGSLALADQITQKIEISATADKVWAEIGDFCGIKNWHPVVASCDLDKTGKAPVRTLTTTDGGKIVEQETSWNDLARAYSYVIVDSPLPVERYHSTLKVLALSSGKSEIIWSAFFNAKGESADADKAITGIFTGGLNNLKTRLEATK